MCFFFLFLGFLLQYLQQGEYPWEILCKFHRGPQTWAPVGQLLPTLIGGIYSDNHLHVACYASINTNSCIQYNALINSV